MEPTKNFTYDDVYVAENKFPYFANREFPISGNLVGRIPFMWGHRLGKNCKCTKMSQKARGVVLIIYHEIRKSASSILVYIKYMKDKLAKVLNPKINLN